MVSRLFSSPQPPPSRIYMDSDSPVSYLKIPNEDNNIFVIDNTTVVVSVDGACARNGRIDASAGIGVYFGPDSYLNVSEPVMFGPQTNQRAEILAAIRALEVASTLNDEFIHYYVPVENIVVMSDSEYVVKAMSSYVFKWRQNGWLNAKRGPVVNMDELMRLDELIEELREDKRLGVTFWHVRREYNLAADSLAKQGIYGVQ